MEVRAQDDNPTLGLILCTEQNKKMVKYFGELGIALNELAAFLKGARGEVPLAYSVNGLTEN